MKKKMEITLQIEGNGFIIKTIEPVCEKNKLLMEIKNSGVHHEH